MISILTNAGRKINTESLINGKENYIEFTKLVIGEGAQEPSSSISSLIKPVLTLDIETKKTGKDTVMIRGAFNTGDIQNSFFYKEVGLYAIDRESGNEVLYWYGYHGENAEHIQSESQKFIEKIIDVYIKIDNAEKIVMKINNIKHEIVDFEDYEETGKEMPTLDKALHDVKSLKNLSELFSSTKAALRGLNYAKANKTITKNITLEASRWTGDELPYSYTISIEEVTEDNNIKVISPDQMTSEQYQQMVNAGINGGTQATGSVTLLAYGDKPAIDFPVIVLVKGD